MHETKPFLPKIVVTRVMYGYDDRYGRYVVIPTNDKWYYDDIYELIHYNGIDFLRYLDGYTIKTQFGEYLTNDDLPSNYSKTKHKSRKYTKKRWKRVSGLKHPKTHPEMKQYYNPDIEEYNVKIRGKRIAKHLPQVWWDQHRYNTKNWKKYRRTQWKIK